MGTLLVTLFRFFISFSFLKPKLIFIFNVFVDLDCGCGFDFVDVCRKIDSYFFFCGHDSDFVVFCCIGLCSYSCSYFYCNCVFGVDHDFCFDFDCGFCCNFVVFVLEEF